MVLPHEIYIDQLALPLGGCPLWGSLHPEMDPVDIGDVGHLSEDGGWIKLFNLRTETNPRNLPPNYRPDSLVVADEDIENDIFKGPRCSSSVSVAGGSVKVKAKAKASLSYECKEEKGAVLFVAEDAVARNARNKLPFLQVIKDNIWNWMDLVKQKGRDIEMSDLVLVTGYVRTTTWVAAVFAQKSQSCKFTVGGVLPGANTGAKIKLWGSLNHVNSFAWTGGPEEMKSDSPLSMAHVVEHTVPGKSRRGLLRRNDPRHQCVLVRGYRMADRYWPAFFSSAKKRQGIEVVKKPSPLISERSFDLNDREEHTVVPDDGPASQNALQVALTIPDTTRTEQGARLKKRRPSKTGNEEPGNNSSNQNGNNGDKRRDGGAGSGFGSGGNTGNTHTGSNSTGSGSSAYSGGQSSKTTSKKTSQHTESGKKKTNADLDTTESSQDDLLSPLGTDNLGDSQGDFSEYSTSDVLGSSAEVVLSPWEILLEYILQNEKKADYAIVHDDDFSVLPMQVKSAGELRNELQALRPRIYLSESIGMLEPTALQLIDNPKGHDFYQTNIVVPSQELIVSTYDTLLPSPSPSCRSYTHIPLPKEPQNVI